jgi:hypothetical protein
VRAVDACKNGRLMDCLFPHLRAHLRSIDLF